MVRSADPEKLQQELKHRPHTSSGLPPSFLLGSGARRPSGTAPRPMSRKLNTQTMKPRCTLLGLIVLACMQMTKPRCIQLGIIILAYMPCLALSESDMKIVDECDIGHGQSYTIAHLRSYDNRSLGIARGSTSPGTPNYNRGIASGKQDPDPGEIL